MEIFKTKGQKVIGGIVSGIALGAQFGYFLGPKEMILGGTLGAIGGLIVGYQDSKPPKIRRHPLTQSNNLKR